MIDLPLDKLKPGQVTAQSIYNSSGGSFLTRGTELTPQYIDKLQHLGIANLHVMSTRADEKMAPPDDILSEKTRMLAVKRVYDVFQQVEKNGVLDPEPLAQVADTMVSDIVERHGNLVQLTDLRVHDMYTFAHCVNVAMLSTLIGVMAGLRPKQLEELSLGALMHDLGKISIPHSILNKPGRLTEEEFAIIKSHPKNGFDKILSLRRTNVGKLGLVALQHHEHMDGTGYPAGLKGEHIHLYGRISAIADVYDALTSARPYKKAFSPFKAYDIMAHRSEGHFDEGLLQLFFRNVAIFPVGAVMSLSSGYGIVKDVEFGRTDRPKVFMFANREGRPLKKPYLEDLSVRWDRTIHGVLDGEELAQLIEGLGFDPADLIAAG